MRVLVTGGVGFIGYHVSRALLARGDDVAILDDFSDAPYPTVEKRRNARDLATEHPRVALHEGCVTDRELVARLVANADGVIHLAGLAGVRPSFAAPARYARVNVDGTANVLEAARARGITRFAFASSSSVYGNSTPLPASEEAPAIAPESPYAASKRGAELIASAICRRAPDIACAALRFFTVYGPRQRPEMAITLFTRAVLAGRTITMFGDGTMRRDFTHVDDIVPGVIGAFDRAPAGFRAYNLGSGAPIDLAGLVRAIGETVGSTPRVEQVPAPIGTSTRPSRTSLVRAGSSALRRACRYGMGCGRCSIGCAPIRDHQRASRLTARRIEQSCRHALSRSLRLGCAAARVRQRFFAVRPFRRLA